MKRKMITFWRILKSGGKNFFRNAWLTIAATAVMVVALTIVLLAIVLNTTARNAIKELSKSLKVSIYLKDQVGEPERAKLERAIRTNPYVSNIQYISVEEARQKFSESFQNDQNLLEGLTLVGGEALPASLEVSVNNLDHINEVAEVAKSKEYEAIVDSITLGKTDAKKTIDRAASAQRFIVTSSILAAGIFAAVSFLIIFNTIRMAIYTRSEEIRIMKLIGATPNYIRGPFLVEASLYGIVAGCIANAAVYSVILSIGSKVATQAEFAETYNFFVQPGTMFLLLLGAMIAGVLVAMISSMLAMERYLRLKHW
jgi:cell division transport system permease protein